MVNGQVHVHGRRRRNGHTGPGGLQSLEFMEVPEKRPLKAVLVASPPSRGHPVPEVSAHVFYGPAVASIAAAALRDAALVSSGAHRGAALVVGGDASLADAGAVDDPLAGSLYHLFEVGVGEDAFGKIFADAGDACGHGHSLVRLGAV